MVGKDQKIPAKIVCVRNKKNRKDWIAFICTNPDLSEDEIILNIIIDSVCAISRSGLRFAYSSVIRCNYRRTQVSARSAFRPRQSQAGTSLSAKRFSPMAITGGHRLWSGTHFRGTRMRRRRCVTRQWRGSSSGRCRVRFFSPSKNHLRPCEQFRRSCCPL